MTRFFPKPTHRVLAFMALLGSSVTLAGVLLFSTGSNTLSGASERPLPEFVHTDPASWINSKPLSKAELKDNVVLVVVWTSI